MNKSNGTDIFLHSDKNLSSFTDKLGNIDLDSSYYLLVLAGPYKTGKNNLLKKLEKKIGDFHEIDLRSLITRNEEESYEKIDKAFKFIGETEKNLILRNGDVLAGEYTGFTYSSVRYATPQEKYLLKKIRSSEKFFVLDIQEFENIDKTLERHAQTIIRFDQPLGSLGKFFWKLRQITVHGHTFANKRPPASF